MLGLPLSLYAQTVHPGANINAADSIFYDPATPADWVDPDPVNVAEALDDLAATAGGTGHTIRDEGTDRPARTGLNFIGAGVSCVDDAGGDETDCTITGSGSAALNDITDVTLTAPATGATLIKSAGDWIDGQLDLADTDAVTGLLPVGNIGNGLTDAQLLNTVTAGQLAADPGDCAANEFATAINTTADLTCAALVDADIPSTLVLSVIISGAADPADSGSYRLGNTDTICWERSPTGAPEVCVQVDANENFTIAGGNIDATVLSGAVPATSVVLAGDVDGNYDATDIDEVAVQSELEGVLILSNLQGSVTDGQVPTSITIDLAAVASAVAFDNLTDPAGGNTLAMAETQQIFNWNTATSAAAFDGFRLNLTFDAATADGNIQQLMLLQQINGGNDAVGQAEALLAIFNLDLTIDDAPLAGIDFGASVDGGMPIAIDASDSNIDTVLAIGTNDITVDGITLSASELSILNGGVRTDEGLCHYEVTGTEINCDVTKKALLEGKLSDVADIAEADGDVY